MPPLKNQNETDAYYLAGAPTQRAAGVIWPALVENRIDDLFDVALRPDQKVRNEILQPTGALGNFAVKVRVAYLFGWIGKDIFDDLLLLTKIRNRFAHAIEATDFTDQAVLAQLKNMNVYKLLPGMLESAEKRAKEEPKSTSKAMVLILKGAIDDPEMGFRFCIDQMIHYLDKRRDNMKQNLSSLPGSWLVGDEKPVFKTATTQATE